MESSYTLEKTEDAVRPWAITRSFSLQDSIVKETVFTFEARDKHHADHILDNLNAGASWETGREFASLSLEDTDNLAGSS